MKKERDTAKATLFYPALGALAASLLGVLLRYIRGHWEPMLLITGETFELAYTAAMYVMIPFAYSLFYISVCFLCVVLIRREMPVPLYTYILYAVTSAEIWHLCFGLQEGAILIVSFSMFVIQLAFRFRVW